MYVKSYYYVLSFMYHVRTLLVLQRAPRLLLVRHLYHVPPNAMYARRRRRRSDVVINTIIPAKVNVRVIEHASKTALFRCNMKNILRDA